MLDHSLSCITRPERTNMELGEFVNPGSPDSSTYMKYTDTNSIAICATIRHKGTPSGIRTRASGFKDPRPGPLDDRGVEGRFSSRPQHADWEHGLSGGAPSRIQCSPALRRQVQRRASILLTMLSPFVLWSAPWPSPKNQLSHRPASLLSAAS